MVWLLRKCEKCDQYTLNTNKCPKCSGRVHIPHPAKFSPNDRYAKQRIMLRVKASKNEDDN